MVDLDRVLAGGVVMIHGEVTIMSGDLRHDLRRPHLTLERVFAVLREWHHDAVTGYERLVASAITFVDIATWSVENSSLPALWR